jgi:hypothetical protein
MANATGMSDVSLRRPLVRVEHFGRTDSARLSALADEPWSPQPHLLKRMSVDTPSYLDADEAAACVNGGPIS